MHKAMGLIFGNIHEKEIPEITASRTLGSLPFFGRYRLVDFALSNMSGSGIKKVGIITKTNYQSLMGHVGSGKQWDLSRRNGGLSVLPPFGLNGSGGTYNSRFEALSYNLNFVKQADEEYLVMSDCDAVCSFDFDAAIEKHAQNNADITLIYRKKDLGKNDSKTRTVIKTDESGRITKMEMLGGLKGINNVYTNMLIIGRRFLLNVFEKMPKGKRSFTQDVLIDGVKKYKIFGYELEGYFASIDSLSNYYKHTLELLDADKRRMLFEGDSRIYTKDYGSPPCKIGKNATVINSVIADGCIIEGEVKNSVLSRGVRVSAGAVIENSIVFQNTIVGRGSRLNCVIADKNCKILEDRLLSGHSTHPYCLTKGSVI